jgi:rhamnogalacturonyl hydrolase YesR
MFTYAVARGVTAHWLDTSYRTVALRGWEAVSDHVDKDGILKGVCMGTGISRDLPFYYLRPTPDDDVHGMGAVILAALAVNDL